MKKRLDEEEAEERMTAPSEPENTESDYQQPGSK